MNQCEINITVHKVERKVILNRRRKNKFKIPNLFMDFDSYDILIILFCIIMISFIGYQKYKIDNIIEKTEKVNNVILQVKHQEPVYTINKIVLTPVPVINPTSTPLTKIYPNVNLSAELQNYTYKICKDNDIPFDIFMSLIWRESNFDPTSISKDGHDYGLCQIRDCHFDEFSDMGITNIMDPKQNIKAAIHILAPYVKKYKNESIHLALMCYNQGTNGAKETWNKGIYSTRYSRSIVDYANKNFN